MDTLETLTQNYFAIFESKAGERYISIMEKGKKKKKSTAILLRSSYHPSIYTFEIWHREM